MKKIRIIHDKYIHLPFHIKDDFIYNSENKINLTSLIKYCAPLIICH